MKLVYLEMFGHDMSWAAFHVLEVMSSAKYLQKRVGYLGAVQSFRPDTEVLMLAENLLKKVKSNEQKSGTGLLTSRATGHHIAVVDSDGSSNHYLASYHYALTRKFSSRGPSS